MVLYLRKINRWKEETPVSRLIDELVGKKSQYKFGRYLRGVFASLLFLLHTEVEIINKQKRGAEEIVNDAIRCKEMLVITDKGEKLGVLSRAKALAEAEESGLDLVLVSPDSNPPVAKLMDYSRFRFEQQKKLKEMRKNQKVIVVQEIQLSPTIEKHDFETKARKAQTILEKGNKVKISLRFKGRMIVHQELGKDVIERFVERLAEYSTLESPIRLEGRTLFAVIAPKTSKD
ncbi:MAG: translation initiation factor IF-3 [Anaeroplasmataceae bacterium]|nr:translation initiation factor IF-3 [Anaeroplasmataceae bacterium]